MISIVVAIDILILVLFAYFLWLLFYIFLSIVIALSKIAPAIVVDLKDDREK